MIRSLWLGFLALVVVMNVQASSILYQNMSGPLPPDVTSLQYESNATSEFGEIVGFGSGSFSLSTVTLLFSSAALQANYVGQGDATGFNVAMTLNIWTQGFGDATGTLLGSFSQVVDAPWRPVAGGGCGAGYLGSDNMCHSGIAFTESFNTGGLVVPQAVIWGLQFNTKDYGPHPVGSATPADQLGIGIETSGASTGSDPIPGTAYWQTAVALFYADHGAAGVNVFRQDQGWSPSVGGATFVGSSVAPDVPEPSNFPVFMLGLFLVTFGRWRKKAKLTR
jgi:hypothetical protein